MRLAYVISNEAGEDLENIWFHTSQQWSVAQADRYYNLIFDEISFICKEPRSGKQMDHVRKGYRVSKVKSHLIFYKINIDVIEVIRILHQRMDVEHILTE